jgi:hypothetical protein
MPYTARPFYVKGVWVALGLACLLGALDGCVWAKPKAVYTAPAPQWQIPGSHLQMTQTPALSSPPPAAPIQPRLTPAFVPPKITTMAIQPGPTAPVPTEPVPTAFVQPQVMPTQAAPSVAYNGLQLVAMGNPADEQWAPALWVLPMPSPPAERAFTDIGTLASGVFTAQLQHALPFGVGLAQGDHPAVAPWLQQITTQHYLSPLPGPLQGSQQVLLLTSWLDTLNTQKPANVLGYVRMLTSDTRPNTPQYRLVMQAKLVAVPGQRVLWQGEEAQAIPGNQVVALNRQAGALASNAVVFQHAASTASQRLINQFRCYVTDPVNGRPVVGMAPCMQTGQRLMEWVTHPVNTWAKPLPPRQGATAPSKP